MKVSPNILTFVFALDEVAARTSAKYVAFGTSFAIPSFMTFVVPSAAIPNAVIASVTISDVLARSSPDAAARFIMPSIPFSMSVVSHPAIAIYCMASADSVAENFVLAPISLAFSVSWLRSSPEAPEIALTFDMPSSKLEPTEIAAPAADEKAPVAAPIALFISPAPPDTREPSFPTPSLMPESSIPVSTTILPSAIQSPAFIHDSAVTGLRPPSVSVRSPSAAPSSVLWRGSHTISSSSDNIPFPFGSYPRQS